MKKRKKFKDKPRLFSPKKIRRWLVRLGLVAVGVGVGVLVKPSLIQDSTKRAQVEDMREQILQANEVGQEKALQVLGESAEVIGNTVDKTSSLAKDLSGKDPQVIVEEKVSDFKEEIKSLPEKQIKKIKLEFCQDVIKEIELSCKAENWLSFVLSWPQCETEARQGPAPLCRQTLDERRVRRAGCPRLQPNHSRKSELSFGSFGINNLLLLLADSGEIYKGDVMNFTPLETVVMAFMLAQLAIALFFMLGVKTR